MKTEHVNLSSNQTKYLQIYQTRREIMLNNFIGGVSWALGATIGLTIILGVLTLVAHYVNVIPFVGTFISDILDYVLRTNHHFAR